MANEALLHARTLGCKARLMHLHMCVGTYVAVLTMILLGFCVPQAVFTDHSLFGFSDASRCVCSSSCALSAHHL
jgi:hypothetical protein